MRAWIAGMATLREEGLKKVAEGVTSLDKSSAWCKDRIVAPSPANRGNEKAHRLPSSPLWGSSTSKSWGLVS